MDTILIRNPNSKKNIKNNESINKKDIIIFEDYIHTLMKYSNYNPIFFKKIIIENTELEEEDLKKLYNMCLVNGTIYFPEKYNDFFKNSRMIKKQKNYVYPLKNRIVDFIIIGAQRCGTTALSLNISKHPEIYLDNNQNPEKGEVHFFDINWKKGIEWYKKQLKSENKKNKIIGEKTPDLAYLSYTFPLIQSVNPFVKLIIIIRNPVERAYSHWKLATKRNGENLSFSKAVAFELKYLKNQNKTFYTCAKHYIGRGFYYKQIKELLKWFPKENLLILISEHVKKNMKDEYNKVYNFLNIKEKDNLHYKIEFQSNDKSEINSSLYKKLINLYQKDILNLEKMFNIKTNWI